MTGATRMGELRRTAEMLTDIVMRDREPNLKVGDMLHLLRATNRTNEQDLTDLIEILDEVKTWR